MGSPNIYRNSVEFFRLVFCGRLAGTGGNIHITEIFNIYNIF